MKNTKKAFTLVELIVVITILAILGTIAFISLQGYSQEAKNSKVTSDLRNITSAIETDSTRNGTLLSDVITGNQAAAKNDVAWTFGSGITLDAASAAVGGNYEVGTINFAAIGQNGEDFKDPNSGLTDAPDYIFAYVTDATFKGYQIVGQIVENDVAKGSVTGTYYEKITGDVNGLVSTFDTTTAVAVENDTTLVGGSLNLYK